ncbi:MAG: tRNA (adenosine(37)-N6)-threonylcarbamoyltransferase complex transferase subunit TsaD, partial [bacterium]|nr:tRNA (adenosine(37)-N6)-threonylcarbamoyltransferase complex transferase subunit TsaD [bacterium]
VSGGHTMLVLVKDWGEYEVIGETLDDACGEAFDKVAKLLGLGYPGGPIIEKMAKLGDATAFSFPRPMLNADNFNFSFSGLKTAVLYAVRKIKKLNKKIVQDICASFQAASFDVLAQKTIKAAKKYDSKTIILAGGVAANKTLQNLLAKALDKEGRDLLVTNFPTDNAAMIAACAYPRAIKKDYAKWHNLNAEPNLRI